MPEPEKKSLREIIDTYSPIVRGKKGLAGLALKAFAKPLELAQNLVGAVSRFPVNFGYENDAGQIITDCAAVVPVTFRRMEQKLRDAFHIAARREASPIDRENFLRVAGEIRRDGDDLSRHCTILRTEFDTVTEKYTFVLMKEAESGKLTTLDDGIHAVQRRQSGLPEEDAAAAEKPAKPRRKPFDLHRPDGGGKRGITVP